MARARRYPKRRTYGRNYKRVRYSPGYSRVSGIYGRMTLSRERKFYDVGSATTQFSGGAPAIICPGVVQVPAGTGPSDRVGEMIFIKSLHLKGYLVNVPQAGTPQAAHNIVRLVVVLDKQTNGVQANYSDVFDQNALQTYRKIENTERFSILADKTITFQATGSNPTPAFWPEQTRFIQYNKSFSTPIPIKFAGVAGTISELKTNNIFVMAIGNNAGSNTVCSFYGRTRIRYTD